MNWGNKLIVVFIAFASLMSYMVYRCVQTPVDLVTKEYYRDELAYQDVIDGTKNANTLTTKIFVQQDSAGLALQFPVEMKNRVIKGNLLFYCVADSRRDRKVVLQLDEFGRQRIDIKSFFPGNYSLKASWESNGKNYYSEEPITIF